MYKRVISLQEVEAKIGRKKEASQRVSNPREMTHQNFVQVEAPM